MTKFCVVTHVGRGVFLGGGVNHTQILSGPGPQRPFEFFWDILSVQSAQRMRNSNQILHGEQSRGEEHFY